MVDAMVVLFSHLRVEYLREEREFESQVVELLFGAFRNVVGVLHHGFVAVCISA
jgi:hypothetical protein